MTLTEFLDNCRLAAPDLPSEQVLAAVRYTPDATSAQEESDLIDLNDEFRDLVCFEINRTLTVADRELVRFLLEQEIANHGAGWGVNECIKVCAFMLFKLGYVEDALLIWRAKNTSFDTFCGVDAQMLVGAGVDRTVVFLRNEGSKAALAAAYWIEGCHGTGDFRNIGTYQEEMERYFGDAPNSSDAP